MNLLEDVPHLGHLSLEPFQLLVDPLVPLQLLHAGPLTMHIRAEKSRNFSTLGTYKAGKGRRV